MTPTDRRPRRNPLRARLAAAVLLGLGAAGAWGAGRLGTGLVEQHSAAAVRSALAQGGFDWAEVAADGLSLRLAGTAPDELSHFRAVTTAAGQVSAARIDDAIVVPAKPEAAPPEFRVEVLRNGQGSSVIGLAPRSLDRAAILQRLARAAGGTAPTDLVEVVDQPSPPGFDAAVAFGLSAAELAPRAKVTVTPGRVEVTAVADGAADKARLEQTLRDATPPGVTLVADISAPRPVIAPFVLTATRTEAGLRLDPCAADTPAARDRILAAVRQAGAKADCTVALGAPSPQWADAAVAAIRALADLPAGRVTISDTTATLDAPASVPQARFDAAERALSAALPRIFSLTASLEKAPETAENAPVRFVATAGAQGGVQLRGAVSDDRMRTALESFAGARFGQVDSGLTMNADAPAGWTLRVIGALEAMADLQRGTATVTPDLIRIAGTTGSTTAAEATADRLSRRLGPGARYELALTYDPRLDPALNLPTGEQCVARLNDTMAEAEIGFEPNRSVIADDPAETVSLLAATMKECGDFRIEIGGHTDSQGSEPFNAELSQGRAAAVLEVMRAAGIATDLIAAKGYGETRPVADNNSEAGREANRRIEFRLLSPYPVSESAKAAEVVTGVTEALSDAEAEAPATPPVTASAPMIDRLPGTPPDLAGAANAAETVAADQGAAQAGDALAGTGGPEPSDLPADPAAEDADAPATAVHVPPPPATPDERAAAEGISLRPDSITVRGATIWTPVPPPLAGGPVTGPPTDGDRPAARPERPAP